MSSRGLEKKTFIEKFGAATKGKMTLQNDTKNDAIKPNYIQTLYILPYF
jgi:hypothetical protein